MNGSDETSETQTSQRPFGGPLAVASVTLGLITWPIAFNLGAYGEVFYDDIFRVVVASSILFLIVVFSPPYSAPALWVVLAALASPLLWVLVSGYVVGSTSDAMTRPGFVVWLVLVAVVSVPITLRLLVDLFTPDVSRSGSRRLTTAIVFLVAVVAVVGFTAGWQNQRFMTCADFAVAGSSEPEDCVN